MGMFFIVFFLVLVVFGIFWLWMLIDVLSKQQTDKVVWVLVVLFLYVFGATLYYFIARKKRLAESPALIVTP